MVGNSLTLRDGRELSYQVSKAAKPGGYGPVLLSNSLCAPYQTWDYVVQSLNERGLTVIRYDQPGHGDSTVSRDLSSIMFRDLAEDVSELLRQLQIWKLYAWIGVSMGAATGVHFATMYPGSIEKLFICDTISTSPVNAKISDVFSIRAEAAQKDGTMDTIFKDTIDRWFSKGFQKDNAAEVERVRRIMKATSVAGFATCCAALSSPTFNLQPLASKLGDCVDEVIFVVGENDASLPQSMAELREMAAKASSNKSKPSLHIIKDAGHVCYIDNLPGFKDVVGMHLLQQSTCCELQVL